MTVGTDSPYQFNSELLPLRKVRFDLTGLSATIRASLAARLTMHILVCDPVSPKGIDLLKQRSEFKVSVLKERLPEASLIPMVADVDALVVRSETKVTRKVIEAAVRLKVVGRAGVGVD